jgi:predicted transposase/invertase (TIGR01784 family)
VNKDISILPPTNDWIFKILFGDERHKDNTVALLRSFLDLPDEEFDITFMDTVLKPEDEEDKTGILDIKLKTKSGLLLDVEIQVNPFPELGKRISFYKSKLVTGQIGEGEGYDIIRRVICVCIMDYPYPPFAGTKEYLNRFWFYNPANGLSFDDIPEEIYTMELPKVPAASDGSAVWDWMQFLRGKRKEDFEMIAERNPGMRGAINTLYRLSEDPEVRVRMEYREKARRDNATLLNAAVREGETRAKRETAKALKAAGVALEQIAMGTGLSPQEIAAL